MATVEQGHHGVVKKQMLPAKPANPCSVVRLTGARHDGAVLRALHDLDLLGLFHFDARHVVDLLHDPAGANGFSPKVLRWVVDAGLLELSSPDLGDHHGKVLLVT